LAVVLVLGLIRADGLAASALLPAGGAPEVAGAAGCRSLDRADLI